MIDLEKVKGVKYVVAFSGGMDSALLAFLLKKNGYEFRLIHAIHPNSKASNNGEELAKFCKVWAETYNVPITCIHLEIDPLLIKSHGVEAAERDARYTALLENLEKNEILLTGHHLDDSIETILFRLARGSSSKGLSGISRSSPSHPIIRPLLHLTKTEIRQQVEASCILYGHDSTNDSTELSRGFVRNKIVPLFIEHFSASKFYKSMQRFMQNMAECAELNRDLFNMDTQTLGTNETGVNRKAFAKMSVARQRNFIHHLVSTEFAKNISSSVVNEIIKRVNTCSRNDSVISVSFLSIKLDKHSFYLRG